MQPPETSATDALPGDGNGGAAIRLRLAVVGCGVAAQTRHLPALARLDDRFRIVALCDTDPRALEQATRWAIGCRTFGSVAELFAAAELFDAVVIATGGDHVAEIHAAAAAGKHMFVEKPLSLTPEQSRPVVSALEAAGVTCVVGYMKRYSAAVTAALEQFRSPSGLRSVRTELIHPPEDRYLQTVLGWARPQGGSLLDFVHHQVTEGDSADAIRRTVGIDAPPAALAGYFLLATSVIHDVNLLRTALGGEAHVVHAALRHDGLSGHATLSNRYGQVGLLSYAFVGAGRYHETLSLVGDTTRCAVSFPSPYLSHAAIVLDTENGDPDAHGDAVTRTLAYDDVFASELIAFHDHVVHGRPAPTGPRDALEDLDLIASIARSAHIIGADEGDHHASRSGRRPPKANAHCPVHD